jgi:hypothetical protein
MLKRDRGAECGNLNLESDSNTALTFWAHGLLFLGSFLDSLAALASRREGSVWVLGRTERGHDFKGCTPHATRAWSSHFGVTLCPHWKHLEAPCVSNYGVSLWAFLVPPTPSPASLWPHVHSHPAPVILKKCATCIHSPVLRGIIYPVRKSMRKKVGALIMVGSGTSLLKGVLGTVSSHTHSRIWL